MNSDNKEWKEFKVKNLFSVEKCKCPNASKLGSGIIPYVGATNKNNGVISFAKAECHLITKGSCIAFICDGQGSVGYSIYKSEDFIGSTTVKIGRNPFLNRQIGMFFVSALDKNRFLYSYGHKRNEKRLLNETILLPSNNKLPDYEYMENYAKEIEKKKLDQYITYIKKRLSSLVYKEIPKLEEKEWKEFFIKNLFEDIQRGKRLTKSNQIEGKVPYISSSSINNGIDNFINNDTNIRKFSNCLSLANSGSVGACFYEPFEFIASDHITHLKNDKYNKYIYLFISCILNRLKEKYNFNREINDKRISREKILLPTNKNNQPDYEYMEQYIKNLEIKKLNQYLYFLNRKYK